MVEAGVGKVVEVVELVVAVIWLHHLGFRGFTIYKASSKQTTLYYLLFFFVLVWNITYLIVNSLIPN